MLESLEIPVLIEDRINNYRKLGINEEISKKLATQIKQNYSI